MLLQINGEDYQIEEDDVRAESWAMVDVPDFEDGSAEFYAFESSEKAGEASVEQWEEMRDHDPQEFRCLVGDETLIAWAMGQHAGPGGEGAASLQEWLDDIVANHPEEQWAGYDGEEREALADEELAEALGWTFEESATNPGLMDCVVYRHN